MKLFITLLGVLVVFAVAFAFWWLSPEETAKRQVRALFAEFSETVNTNDRDAVGTFLQKYLADDAAIQLNVSMSMFGVGATDELYSKQQFTKASFISFIDNTLFSLDKYAFNINLDTLAISDSNQAEIKAIARADAVGLNHRLGKRIATKWVLKSDCDGSAGLTTPPTLKAMHCTISLSQEPDLKGKSLKEVVDEYEKSMKNQ